ncbi:MAG TPA: winged helix-turn-helix domain-containing protein [Candidatus Acidoferrum sp.]|nr:winged helix-turn-helix domain-containing protein [Candidatus Acidoferrum sp.]
MTGRGSSPGPIRFGAYEVDFRAGEVRKNGAKIRLQDQPFRVLQVLLERPGDVVTREELRKQIWPEDTFVAFDTGLNNAIKRLREALGDIAETPRYIETLPRRGYRFLETIEAPLRRIESLAVLPLENLSLDPEQEYFAEGMTEVLITTLAKIGALRVISRTTAMHYKGVHRPLREIAEELQVEAVVEGAVLRVGNRVRISAQLIDAHADTHLWAESYERDLRDVLALQAEIAQAIAREIHIKLTPQEQAHLAQVHIVDPDAYEAYLKGRYYWNKRSRDTLSKGAEFFRRSLEKDPNYAAAYAGLADCASSGGWFGFLPPKEGFGKGKELAREALAIDPGLAEAHASLGWALTHYDFDFVAAEREFERSIELNSHYATAHEWFAMLLGPLGRFDDAIAEFTKAARLDPLAPVIHVAWGWIYFHARRYDEALEQSDRTLELDPNFLPACYLLGSVLMFKDKQDAAVAAYQKGVDLSSGSTSYLGGLGWAYASGGRTEEARAVLAQLTELREKKYVMATNMALIHAGLNEDDEAIRWLEKGFVERSAWMVYLNTDPRYDTLRSDSRFQDLLRRMRFPK